MQNMMKLKQALTNNVAKAIIGKEGAVELMLNAILCRGHVLIEDVPGVGKTTLASALANSMNLSYKRIQFTPDVTPSDVTGYTQLDFHTHEMQYRKGAVFSQIVLADEINRTSPKTQASLLEVMEEGQVTVDGTTYPLPEPFIVLATQNPVDFVGKNPLPEAQLDRFFMKIAIGYPSAEEEASILDMHVGGLKMLKDVKPICDKDDILYYQDLVGQVRVAREIRSYITSIAQASRRHSALSLGISPRGAIYLLRSSQACAMLSGREYVTPDDVQKMAMPVLSHRVVLSPEARMRSMTVERVLASILGSVQAPVRIK